MDNELRDKTDVNDKARDLLWKATPERRENSQMMLFARQVEAKYGVNVTTDYRDLHKWSIQHPEQFWAEVWSFFNIIASKPYDKVVDDLSRFPGADWFQGALLNYAENMLRDRDSDEPALIFRGETSDRRVWTWHQLRQDVFRMATAMRRMGLGADDAVCAFMPNLAETIIAMLASASIGAIWCSCATDIGPQAATDRLGQVEPKLLITTDGYYYKGKSFDVGERAAEITRNIPSVKKVIVTHYAGDLESTLQKIDIAESWESFLGKDEVTDFAYEQLPANHPLVVMFSSGTTGKPKCMVQSAAGLLLNQLKEVGLHHDVTEKDRMLYITTCSWMMWNWMASTLGTGASLVLFDGNPSYPDTSTIWKILEEEKVTVFGLSASYIHALMAEGFVPKEHADLSALRTISQTGSALSDAGFHYVYDSIKADVHFNSIAGGTDINGCFCIGNSMNPVYSNELQAPGLGHPVAAYDDAGKPVFDVQGELVCEFPIPSMPLYFWNDPEGKRFHDAYFDVFPNIWRHGDYVEIHSNTGGITYYGRSDSILKPSGVRIGTSEIYTQVQKVDAVFDSLAIGQHYHDDQRVLLFVQMKEGKKLTKEIAKEIRTTLRTLASPRHVPAVIIEVEDIPRTLNGKIVESAVTNIVNHRAVTNRDALQNPACLDEYEALLPLLEDKQPDNPDCPRLF